MGAASTKQSVYYDEFEKTLPNLTGKNVVITGCTSGTGLVAAKCSVRKGASNVVLLNRESERSKTAHEIISKEIIDPTKQNVETIPCDLMDFDSVQKAADTIKAKYDKVDVLCNNAGVMALEDKATKDGYDVQIQTNHLSAFKLTKELYPLLNKAEEGRIVFHTSGARMGKPLDAKYFEKNGGNLGGNGNSMWTVGARWERYHQSKLANATLTRALAKKLEGRTNIKAVCAAPGLAQTNLQVTSNKDGGMGPSAMWIMHMSQSAEDGTIPLLSACYAIETNNGDFYEPAYYLRGSGPAKKYDLGKLPNDPDQQKLLWEKSEEAVGKFDI